ncbi:hypothetical protein [Micromonospora saelicesensis]|nr:hypothetical protein [Micromonospora saelicesensis]
MRLESPFEVVLTTVANQYSPIAFGVTGIVIVERLVRLVMEWQKHRLEIFQGMDGARASLGGPHHEEAADSIARQVIEPIHRRETWQPEVSDDEIEEAVQSAAGPINRLSRFQLTRVTSSNTGERE